MDEVMSGSSYYSQNDLRLHFGLGVTKTAERVEILWPSGLTESVADISANQLIVILEGKGVVRTTRFTERKRASGNARSGS
jgi:hypothetical protein